MNLKHKIIGCILGIVGAILLLLGIYFQTKPAAASIGIIGGADGPTAIFLAGKLPSGFSILIVIGIVCLVVWLIKLFKKRP